MAERDEDILARARRRFKAGIDWESTWRQRFRDDISFLYADPDNQEQWDANVRARRQIAGQPMVTINKVHTHWLHVVNQMKENLPAITVKPTGDEATYESAQIYGAVIRNIQVTSQASTAYKMAAGFQVGAGMGYWRLMTEYADDNSFDQVIRIKQVPDPLSVVLDNNIKNQDGSDADWGFIFEDIPREKCEAKYPRVKLPAGGSSNLDGVQSWIMKDTVRTANYYEVETRKEWLYAIPTDDGGTRFARESDMEPNERALMAAAAKEDSDVVLRRRVDKRKVRLYVLVGDSIAEKGTWAGSYIPIIRLPGEEVVIEGKLDRKGLTRYQKDAQRAYNYNASAALEYGALQSKSPWTAPVEAIEGLENYWATANTQNHAFLPYNHADENGNPIPEPRRQQPPSSSPAYIDGMQIAERELMMSSGQYEATFSEQGNEVSGVSITKRQKQGERVTYHFPDALNDALRFTGVQLIDLIPKVYDTRRIIRIMGEDGEEQTVVIDPKQQAALQMQRDAQAKRVKAIFNPNVGRYEVVVEAGPSYDTKREEAFEALTNLIVGNPAMAQVIGDLYMAVADFPIADKLRERMRNWINATNPGVVGDGPTPQEQNLMQQLQASADMIKQLSEALAEKDRALDIENRRLDMEALNHLALRMENERDALTAAFKAETDRLKSILGALDPTVLALIAEKLGAEVITAPNPMEDVNPAVMDPSVAYAQALPEILHPNQQPAAAASPEVQQPQ
jgi:hypothetical protein